MKPSNKTIKKFFIKLISCLWKYKEYGDTTYIPTFYRLRWFLELRKLRSSKKVDIFQIELILRVA